MFEEKLMFENSEHYFLLESLVTQRKWSSAPLESEFYRILDNIELNSKPEYKPVAANFRSYCRQYDWKDLAEFINYICNNPAGEDE